MGYGRDALEGKGPPRRPQKRWDRRLEEVAKSVWGGYCWLQMPLRLALAVRETVTGHRLGALKGGGRVPPLLPMHPWGMGVGSKLAGAWWPVIVTPLAHGRWGVWVP